MAETKSVIIDLVNGTSGAKLDISQFTDNFDTVRFSVDSALKNYTFMIVTESDGRSQIIQSSPGSLFLETDNKSGETYLVWKLGREITCTSGIVVYQVVAYELDGEEIKSTWYSKEGRITVSESVDTNLKSAEIIGSYPNLITKIILELDSFRKALETLEETKVTSREGYGLSQNNFSDSDAIRLNSVEDFAQRNVIEKIKIDGTAVEVDSSDKSVNLNLKEKFDSKVDVQSGKGLSSNDFTDGDWFKLDAIEYEAQKNIIEKIKLNGVEQQVNKADKSVNLDISGKADAGKLSQAAFSGKYADLTGIPVTDLGDIYLTLTSLEDYFENITETGIYKFRVIGNGLAGETSGYQYALVTYYTDALGNHVVSQIFLGDAYEIAGYRYGRKSTMTEGKSEFSWDVIREFLSEAKVVSSVSKSGTLPVNSKAVYNFVRPAPEKELGASLTANTAYNLQEVPSGIISFPSVAADGDVLYITFQIGEEVPQGLAFDTTFTSDIEIDFSKNTGYEIFGKYNGNIWIVNYSEYTVTDGETV